MKKTPFHSLRVRPKPGERTRGWLLAGPLAVPVALGRGGIRANKREGDGGTPRGTFRLRRLWWRADRMTRPMTYLPVRRIRGDDGWCEDPRDRHYNQPIRLEPDQPGDRLKRADHLYDLILELDHNTRPRIAGRGSAVFVHIARPGFAPTAGCVALSASALRRLVARTGPRTRLMIG
ncbi:MAG TPA: L,D-transpeptidase family protein [Bradyrhizobium sp.]|nr:L,D-transpeptidase family protein [Bradyrhizobium sp.]